MNAITRRRISVISNECRDWLRTQYEKSRGYQIGNGIQFNLKFQEYIDLWGARRLRRLEQLIRDGLIEGFQRHKKWAWVLTWRRKEDRLHGDMNPATAVIATREESTRKFFLKKGEKHSDKTKKSIGDKHRGKTITQKHRNAISAAKKGKRQTPAQIAKRVAATKATRSKKAMAGASALSNLAPPVGHPHP
jgi:hypothetical protein